MGSRDQDYLTFDAYLNDHAISNRAAGAALGMDESTVGRLRRHEGNGLQYGYGRRIWAFTGFIVLPTAFFELPPSSALPAQLQHVADVGAMLRGERPGPRGRG